MQFYECESGAFCNSVQFVPRRRSRRPVADDGQHLQLPLALCPPDLDQNQVKLQMDMNLDAGVTADNLEDTLDIWRQLVEIFERDILALK